MDIRSFFGAKPSAKRPAEAAAETPADKQQKTSASSPVTTVSAGGSSADVDAVLASLPPASAELLAPLAHTSWLSALKAEVRKPYFASLAAEVAKERARSTVFPPAANVFTAFTATPLEQVRVVILGQDPYHGPSQAHGLCFSVMRGVAVPPSLKNIYTEMESDVPGFKRPGHGNLEAWASRGIFMLNASLTVKQANANSHAKLGWLDFTDAVIKLVNEKCEGVVFILWGGFAQKKGKEISRLRHCVIEAAHPSPLSVTKFRGCKVFSKANAYLEKRGKEPIDWSIPK